MSGKTLAIRHGDLALVKIDQLPEGLQPSTTHTLMQGSHGNNHDVRNGVVYLKDVDQFVFGYLVAEEGCMLLHPDHGAGDLKDIVGGEYLRKAQIKAGVYELRRQFEQTHDAMKPVID